MAVIKGGEANQYLLAMVVRSLSEHPDFAMLLGVDESSCNHRRLIFIEHSGCIHMSIGVHRV